MATYDGPIDDNVLNAAKATASTWRQLVKAMEKKQRTGKSMAELTVIEQVSTIHKELHDHCRRIEEWLATKPALCDEAFQCLHNGLESGSMSLGRMAMELDGAAEGLCRTATTVLGLTIPASALEFAYASVAVDRVVSRARCVSRPE